MNTTQKGFTLIELLVVIAIIAVLSVVVILTLNPAELLRQARDSNRVSDLSTMKSAISLYLADVSTPALGTALRCYQSILPASTTCPAMATQTAINGSSSRAVTGAGWIPINFNLVSSGAPVGTLPVDPVNNQNFFYSYMPSAALTFKMAMRLESSRYGTTENLDETDGGTSLLDYEAGTDLAL